MFTFSTTFDEKYYGQWILVSECSNTTNIGFTVIYWKKIQKFKTYWNTFSTPGIYFHMRSHFFWFLKFETIFSGNKSVLQRKKCMISHICTQWTSTQHRFFLNPEWEANENSWSLCHSISNSKYVTVLTSEKNSSLESRQFRIIDTSKSIRRYVFKSE